MTKTFYNIILVLTCLIFLIPRTAQSQTHQDSIVMYAQENRTEFWSMIAKFYPLSKDQAIKYQEVLHHRSIEENTQIPWDEELLKIFNVGYFSWYGITRNNAITISKQYYDQCKHNIQEYMNIEMTDSVKLINNWIKRPDLIDSNIVKSALQVYQPHYRSHYDSIKQIYISDSTPYYSLYDTVKISKDLMCRLDDSLKNINIKLLYKNRNSINYNGIEGLPLNWSFTKMDSLFRLRRKKFNYRDEHLRISKFIYKDVFKQWINDDLIDSIYNIQLPESQKHFYRLFDKDDKYGIAPHVYIDKTTLTQDKEDLPTHLNLQDSISRFSYSVEYPYELPNRATDFHRTTGWTSSPMCVVSKRLKNVLENFQLPAHKFHSINLKIDGGIYGRDTLEYYLMVLDHSIRNAIVPNKCILKNENTLFKDILTKSNPDYYSIRTKQDVQYYFGNPKKEKKHHPYRINDLVIDSNLDFLSFPYNGLWVSEDLKKAIEENDIIGLGFKIGQKTRIRMLGLEKEAYKNRKIALYNQLPNPVLAQLTVRNYDKSVHKRTQLIKLPNQVIDYYKNHKNENHSKEEVAMRKMEMRCDVILPKSYRDYLKEITQKDQVWVYDEIESRAIEEIEPIDLEVYGRNPITTKGIIIGGEEYGDGYGQFVMLLKENSSIFLRPIIYYMDLETDDLSIVKSYEKTIISHEKRIGYKFYEPTGAYEIVETMPLFHGCNKLEFEEDQKECSALKVSNFISANIKYPKSSWDNGIEGLTVVQFVVEKNGKVNDIKIVKSISQDCSNEVIRLIELMNKKGLKWTPGRTENKLVRVEMILPIVFKIDK